MGGGRQTTSGMTVGKDAAEALASWNDALLETLLPELEPQLYGQPVLFACDDEAVRRAGEVLGYTPADSAFALASAIRAALQVDARRGIEGVIDLQVFWKQSTTRQGRPDALAVLALCVLAASRMGPGDGDVTQAYYKHLRELLNLPAKGGDPGRFDMIPPIFKDLQAWLQTTIQGQRGNLIMSESPYPPWVGCCIEQTVFRAADRRVLTQFFRDDKLDRREGKLDSLLLLRRWPGRNRLTGHAEQLVNDASHDFRVRAAIASALRSWDGSVLEQAGGRSFELRLRLGPQPVRLFGSANNRAPISFRLQGQDYELEPGREVVLPWSVLEKSGEILGIANSAAGAVRIPGFDDTILFELVEEGLYRVFRPWSSHLWVLTRDRRIQQQFRERRVTTPLDLPGAWQVFRDVEATAIPGVEQATRNEELPQLALTGGLRVQSGLYLSGNGPSLEVGDIGEGADLNVLINDQEFAHIGGQSRLTLPSEAGKSYHVDVPDLGYSDVYHVTDRGNQEGYGSLAFHPADPSCLRAGAMPIKENAHFFVCGAEVLPRHLPELPYLTRSQDDQATLGLDGAFKEWPRPEQSGWLRNVGLPARARWELPIEGVAWLLDMTEGEVTRWALEEPIALSPETAKEVRYLGVEVKVHDRHGNSPEAQAAWLKILRRAEAA